MIYYYCKDKGGDRTARARKGKEKKPMTKKIVMNEKRVAVLETLRNATEPMTLNEIAEAIGAEKVATGTTNPMIEMGYIKVVGTKRVPVVTYREVNVYAIGDNEPEVDNEKGE